MYRCQWVREFIGSRDSEGGRAAAAFAVLEKERPDWPHDSVIEVEDGRTAIVRTIISRNRGDLGQTWYAIAYSFVFDGRQLIAWDQRRYGLVDTADL